MAKAKARKRTSTHIGDNIFVMHGEKAVFLAIVGLVVLMITKGSGLPEFKLTPEQINQASAAAKNNIETSKVKPAEVDPGVVVYDYSDYSNLIKTAVKVNAYETPIRWDQSLFPDRIKRPDIVPLPIENLKAVACIGSISYMSKNASAAGANPMGGMGGEPGMMSGGGGNEEKGRQWITITGSIPVRRQLADYMSQFSAAQYTDSYRDQPKYIFYEIERGTAKSDGSIEWKKLDLIKAMRNENNRWAGIGMEQVDMSYFAPVDPNYPTMAMPCPPMTNRLFGEEVANLPNIPIQSEEMMEQASIEMEKRNQLLSKMQNVQLDDILKRSPFSDNQMAGGMAGGMGDGMGDGMGGMGDGMGGPSGGMGQGAGTPGWMVNKKAFGSASLESNVAPVDYYLFRYFDFDVLPDQTYIYRVKLNLANPNYGLDQNFVENPKTVTKTFISSDYSTESNPVSLGMDSRIFFENIEETAKGGPGQEPLLTVVSIYFDKDSASESMVKGLKVVRGQVANFPKQNHKPIENNKQSTMGMDPMGGGMMPGMDGPAPSRKKKKKESGKIVDHVSEICVLDAFGGYPIPNSDIRSPARALILEPNGLVQMRELSEDARELNRYENQQATPGGMGMEGSMPGMM